MGGQCSVFFGGSEDMSSAALSFSFFKNTPFLKPENEERNFFLVGYGSLNEIFGAGVCGFGIFFWHQSNKDIMEARKGKKLSQILQASFWRDCTDTSKRTMG